MTNPLDLDAQIDLLKPNCSVEIGRYGDVRTIAERSSDGHTIRFVRITPTGFQVFRSIPFEG